MCGIIGVVGISNAAHVLIDSLEHLAYRGYDSAGIVTSGEGGVHCLKRAGKITILKESVDASSFPGDIGLGHSRWATHGPPTELNAHPLTTDSGRYHVICNGIIENYRELRNRLIQEGHVFSTQTDTEVVPVLLESYSDELTLEEKIFKVLNEIEGSYAVVVLDSEFPDQLWGARNGSPLLVARNEQASFLASDVPAVLEHTREVRYLNDGEVVQVKAHGHVRLMDLKGSDLSVEFQTIDFDFEQARKDGYPHYMLKEIHEQPLVVDRTIKAYLTKHGFDFSQVIDLACAQEIEEVIFVACGTAYHAGLVGQYLFESLGIRAKSKLASEFHLFPSPVSSRSLVIGVTQSGETIDTLYALRKARQMGARTLAICNAQGSTIVRESDMALMMQAGVEVGVASTKAYLTMLTVIYMLGPWLAQQRNSLPANFDLDGYINELKCMPEKIEKVLKGYGNLKGLLEEFAHFDDYFYIARGFNLPTVLEGALKLKELTYLHAEGYGAGEMKHGPIALVDDRLLTIAIAPQDGLEKKMASNIEEIRARNGHVFLVTSEESTVDDAIAHWILKIPHTRSEFTPLLTVIPLQILSYEVAVLRKCDPDQPRNLAKSVTVE